MANVMRKIVFISLFLLICLVHGAPRAQAAAGQYISDIILQTGDNAEDRLIEKGYSVMYPALINGAGEKIRIGYKMTENSGDGITDIIVETKKENVKKKFGKKTVKYQPVPGGSLGVGGKSGKPDKTCYIHCTKDGQAGSLLTALHFLSSDTGGVDGFNELLPLANNGTVPVKNSDGTAAAVQSGENSGYLSVVRSDIWKNYIGSVVTAKGKTKKDVVMELCRLGCEYYVDRDFGGEGDVTMVGYTRTSDKKSAVKDLIGLSADNETPAGYEKVGDTKIADKYLFISVDEKYGNPLVDLDYMKNAKELDLTAKGWTSLVIARGDNTVAAPYLTGSDEYIKLQESKEKYILTAVDCEDEKDTGLVYTTEKEGLKEKQKEKRKKIKNSSGDSEEVKSEKQAEEDDDEAAEPAKESQTIQYDEADAESKVDEQSKKDEDVSGSAVDTDGVGTVLSGSKAEVLGTAQTVVLFLVILLIPAVTIIIKKNIEIERKK